MNQRPSVLMVAQSMIGGASEHIKVLGVELQSRGWGVSVAANWRPEYSPVLRSSFEEVGLATHSIDFPSPRVNKSPRIGIDAIRAGQALAGLLRQEKPDIVHAHWRSVLPYCLLPNCPPVVFTKHLPGATDWLSNRSYRIPCRAIAISSELQQEMLTRSHLPNDRIRLVLHGVDRLFAETRHAEKECLRRKLGLPHDHTVLVSVGRLAKQKDHCLTLEAVRRLKLSQPPIHLVIVGEGPLRVELLQQIDRFGLREHVTLTGHAPPAPYLDAADIFVLSSIYEGFALAVVEAMMRGLPPIRTLTGGAIDQIEPNVSGLLFSPGDAAGLVEGITVLASNPGVRSAMGSAARERARMLFTSALMAENTEAVYREVMH